MNVNITNHAYYDRYLQYKGEIKRQKLAKIVEKHLFMGLKKGVCIKKRQ